MEDTEFITDSELNTYINASITELYDMLVATNEDYYTKLPVPEYTVSSGANTLDLPTDFYKLRGIDLKLGTDYIPLYQYNFTERNAVQRSDLARFLIDAPVQYRVIGSKIFFLPESEAPGTYKLWYVPRFTKLSLDADTFDGINGWEEYVIVDVVIKMLNKEESDVSPFIKAKEDLIKRINSMAGDRDLGSPEKISDVNGISNRLFRY